MSNHSSKVDVSARPRTLPTLFSTLECISALLLSLILSSVTLIASASAATITVGNAGDPATGNAAKCNVANTCSLRDAIAKAADVSGTAAGDTIVFSLPANSTITLSGSALIVDRNLTIDGSAVSGLAISGNHISRVLEIHRDGEYMTVTAVLERLIVTGGSGTYYGGGIYNNGTLTLIDSTVSNNTASEGGGIRNEGTLTLTNTTVSNNVADGGGGGIENYYGSLTLTNSMVLDNTAGGVGGGINNQNDGPLTLTNSTVSGNKAGSGGGIDNTGSLILINSAISNNTVTGAGGGIFNRGNLTLAHSNVSDNTAGEGGGIENIAHMTLTDSVVSNNAATDSGGGICNYDHLTLTNSTAFGNTAVNGSGGGIGCGSDGATITLNSSTVSDNTATNGGGIRNNAGSLKLINSTVSGNAASAIGSGIYNEDYLMLIHDTLVNNTSTTTGTGNDVYNAPFFGSGATLAINTIIQNCAAEGSNTTAITDNGGNLDGGNGCGFTNASSKPNATLDLGVLADNGGATLTMMPGTNSDAIGRGLPSACRSSPVNSRDQRDYVRPAIGCSSGAVDPNGLANESIFFDGFGLGGQ